MPVYDYSCTQCGRTVEVVHGVHGHGPATCETCGGTMRKLLSTPAIVFKGSGWAKKDASAASHARAGKKHAPASSDVSTSGGTSAGGSPGSPGPGSSGSSGTGSSGSSSTSGGTGAD